MGCDIHTHWEMKINGKWHFIGRSYGHRNYNWFTVIAGVRDYEDEGAYYMPRGLPDNLDQVTLDIINREKNSDPEIVEENFDYHNHSYLNLAELEKCVSVYQTNNETLDEPERLDTFREMLNLSFVEDIRMVFFFDN